MAASICQAFEIGSGVEDEERRLERQRLEKPGSVDKGTIERIQREIAQLEKRMEKEVNEEEQRKAAGKPDSSSEAFEQLLNKNAVVGWELDSVIHLGRRLVFRRPKP